MNPKDHNKDEEIAQQIRTQLGSNTEVEQLLVKGRLLQMHVTGSFYNRLAVDRERGRKIVLALMQRMKSLTGSPEVSVWIYCNNEKMIEGQVKEWGGDNVRYLYDL
ncbi:MAG: hypothetical protein R3351_06535 [Nitrospirales bacterium]|nr:hypothetical protein [Nitrospirales bacterium]